MTADVRNIVTRKNIASANGLLQMLVPRAKCFCFYNLSRSCAWSSEGVDDYEIDDYIAELPDNVVAGTVPDSNLLRRTLGSGRTLLVLPVHGNTKEGLGLLVIVFSKNAGKSSWFNPDQLKNMLLPAVQTLGESMRLNQQLGDIVSRAEVAEKELDLVYKVDEKVHGISRSHAGLAELIGQSGRFLGIAYAVLLLPSKRIRISATHSTWKHVKRKVLDQYVIEQLFPMLEGHRTPILFEVPPVESSDNIADQGYQAMLCPLIDRVGNIEGVLAQLGRVNKEPFEKAHVRFMSHIVRKVEYVIEQSFDVMTGLMNRSGFEAQLHESTKLLAGNEDQHQIVYFDLDNLQLVNDTFGRAAGDEVIIRFSQMLDEALPKNAIATRLTGDDFAMLLTNSTVEEALNITTAVRTKGEQLRYLEGDKSLQVTVSIGIAGFDAKEVDVTDALTASRIACDAAKDHGRDRVEVYDQDDKSIIRRYDDMHLVSEIQKALDADGLELHAQPIIPLTCDRNRSHFEILLRMKDNKGAQISTDAFFSAAERYQIMPQIDRWVVSTTLSKLGVHADFLEATGASFAINLSGQSLGDDEILEFVEDELESSGVPASSLCFEVTESAAVSNRKKAQAFIDALRKRGCKFSLDDFGAGLSSFAYLKSFKVDILKIDGSFIRDITVNRISESMVAAITQVAKVMDLKTVAEYVECAETKTLIEKIGVDFAQGYAVGKPVPLDGVLKDLMSTAKTSTA
jgi:diguanylate cyclase (GGDEF)-like protein